jgi:hypothetical protein
LAAIWKGSLRTPNFGGWGREWSHLIDRLWLPNYLVNDPECVAVRHQHWSNMFTVCSVLFSYPRKRLTRLNSPRLHSTSFCLASHRVHSTSRRSTWFWFVLFNYFVVLFSYFVVNSHFIYVSHQSWAVAVPAFVIFYWGAGRVASSRNRFIVQ